MDSYQLKFKSLPENIYLVEEFVDTICDEFHVSNNYFGNIIVAITEAVENAMIHGNKKNPEKNIFVTFEQKPAVLSFTIEDQGNGFDYNNVTDPTDISKESNSNKGRGMYLIKSLADKVIFSDNGKKIELLFNISSINNELAINRINQFKKYSEEKQHQKNLNPNDQSTS